MVMMTGFHPKTTLAKVVLEQSIRGGLSYMYMFWLEKFKQAPDLLKRSYCLTLCEK